MVLRSWDSLDPGWSSPPSFSKLLVCWHVGMSIALRDDPFIYTVDLWTPKDDMKGRTDWHWTRQ